VSEDFVQLSEEEVREAIAKERRKTLRSTDVTIPTITSRAAPYGRFFVCYRSLNVLLDSTTASSVSRN
jgi:hypothetical protein